MRNLHATSRNRCSANSLKDLAAVAHLMDEIVHLPRKWSGEIRKNEGPDGERLKSMQMVQNKFDGQVTTQGAQQVRTVAHHYGSVKRHASPERALRVFPPLGWCVGNALPHVRRTAHGVIAQRALEVAARIPLAL